MPIYEYKCEKCNIEFEKLVKISDANYVEGDNCPSPQSCQLKRKYSISAVHFKGSGFYETDYKNK